MKKVLVVLLLAAVVGGCGKTGEKARVESLGDQLGVLVSDGRIEDFEKDFPGAGFLKSYTSDSVEADVRIFRGRAEKLYDGIEPNQFQNNISYFEKYLEQYYGAAAKKTEAVEEYRGVKFRSFFYAGGHSNTKMFVTVLGGAYLQVVADWPAGNKESEREIENFMNALVENLKRGSASATVTSGGSADKTKGEK